MTVCVPAIMELAIYASKSLDKIFSFNLSAPFISKAFTQDLFKIMPYVDLLFGNENEALAYAEVKNWDTTDLHKIVRLIVEDKRVNSDKERIVVITQGHDPVLLGRSSSKEIKEYPVQLLTPEEIVDTNGAGDAFVAGFLSQYIQAKDFDRCIKVATYAAQEVIKQSGAAYPKHPPKLD